MEIIISRKKVEGSLDVDYPVKNGEEITFSDGCKMSKPIQIPFFIKLFLKHFLSSCAVCLFA